MDSFSVAGYIFDLLLDFRTLFVCKSHEISQKGFERLAVFVKITASRSSYLFLQQTVINRTIRKTKQSTKI